MDNYPLTKVLVVDDQPLIVEELCEFLESSGYECVRCYSSLEAIERFSADSTIGIVLCDLEMPGMNGIEMVEAMKMTGGKTHLFEAIMLTGQAEKKTSSRRLGPASPITTRSRSIWKNCSKACSCKSRR